MRNPLEKTVSAFVKRHHVILISLTLALFSLHLALTDRKEVERGALLNAVLSYTVTPVQRLALWVQGSIYGVWDGYIALVGVNEENEFLKRSLFSLEEENRRLKEEIRLNGRLKELLAYREAAGYTTVAASLTGFHADLWTRTVTLNKGASDGIGKDMAIITPQGVVGRILSSTSKTSTVLLNTDSRSAIDVLTERSRVKGVAEGNGSDGLILKYVRQIDDVQVGDKVITSGISGIFPKGLMVGEVTKVELSKDTFFRYVEVRPSTDLNRLEEVLVITDAGFSGLSN